jgi:hypothetical protein
LTYQIPGISYWPFWLERMNKLVKIKKLIDYLRQTFLLNYLGLLGSRSTIHNFLKFPC